MALSDTWLKSNNGKARAALEERGDREGLSVRITPKGKITFQLRYRYHGTPKRLDLGSYPLMSLKEARGEALRLRHCHRSHLVGPGHRASLDQRLRPRGVQSRGLGMRCLRSASLMMVVPVIIITISAGGR